MAGQFVIGKLDKREVLPESFADGIRQLIVLCDFNKIVTIRLIRQLQFSREYFRWVEDGCPTCVEHANHPFGLKDAKDVVEDIAAYYHLTFK